MSEREILFRGQTRRKGEKVRISGEPVDSNWVYGGIFPGEGDFSIIYQTKPKIEKFTVYSDTVGQFTGLTDKNGTRIFEGDIVKQEFSKFRQSTNGICEFHDGSFGLKIKDLGIEKFLPFACICNATYKVIGNIYDNPELLKGD